MSSSARVQTDSVSSRRPSLSKTTASGRGGGMGAHHVNPAAARRNPVASRPMPFHIEVATGRRHARSFNLTEEELGRTVLDPWLSGRPVLLGDRKWSRDDETGLRILEGPELSIQDLAFSQGWANAERSADRRHDDRARGRHRGPARRSAARRRSSSAPTRRCRRSPTSSPATTPKRRRSRRCGSGSTAATPRSRP